MGTIDMAGNINDLMNLYQQMQQAPSKAQFFQEKFNVQLPTNMNNSFDVIQHFLNSGRFTQQQVNAAMNNPIIKRMFNNR